MTNEQFQELVSLYGENAYLMCDIECHTGHKAESNTSVIVAMELQKDKQALVTAKESASLPFDLIAAKAGDGVEWQDEKGNWIIVPQSELYLFSGIEHKLRMKHPRRVNIDYGDDK